MSSNTTDKSKLKRKLDEIYEESVNNARPANESKKRSKLDDYVQGSKLSIAEIAKAGGIDAALNKKDSMQVDENENNNNNVKTKEEKPTKQLDPNDAREQVHTIQSDTDQLMMKVMEKFKDKAPDYLPRWERVVDDKFELFLFYNKLAGTYTKLKIEKINTPKEEEMKNMSDDQRNSWKVCHQLQCTLPFPVVSFFIDEAEMRQNRIEVRKDEKTGVVAKEWLLVMYNSDPRMAQEALRVDEENFKTQYHPHLMWIDKFSWEFLKTFDWKILFPPARKNEKSESDREQKYIYRFILGEGCPKSVVQTGDGEANKLHAHAMELREFVMMGTIETLQSRLEQDRKMIAEAADLIEKMRMREQDKSKASEKKTDDDVKMTNTEK